MAPSGTAGKRSEPARLARRRLSHAWEVTLLLLIVALAATLRLYRLSQVPPGLHFDEAFEGVMARQILETGQLPLFFPANQGQEPLGVYLITAIVALVGDTPWMIRLSSAIWGTVTVALTWWLGRGLSQMARRAVEPVLDDQLVGLGAAFVLAILYWHLTFSRIGMEPILVPLFITIAFAGLVHGLNVRRAGTQGYWAFVVAGIGIGGAFYTYKAGYFVPVVAAVFVAWAAIVERGFVRRHWRGLTVAALVALVAAAPLALYFFSHPADFLHRPTDVTLVAVEGRGSWDAVADNLPRVAGMFFLAGDENPRSNVPGRPALDPFLAVLFVVGLVRAIAGIRRPGYALAVIWLVVMVVPTLVTEYAPHFPRAIGSTPILAFLCALGGWTAWQVVAATHRRWLAAGAVVALAAGLLFSGTTAAITYFHTWANSPDLFFAYDAGLVDVGSYMRTLPPGERVYVTPIRADHYTLHYVANRPLATFDGRAGLVLPPETQPATMVVFLQEDSVTPGVLQQLHPGLAPVREWADPYGRPYAAAYPLPAGSLATPAPDHASGAILGDAIELVGYSVDRAQVAPGEVVHLTLVWRAMAPLAGDYTVFTHLLGAHNPASGSRLWAGHDGMPDGGRYPTSAWQPGEVILDVHPLSIPSDAPAGEYQLAAGLYDLQTMVRLPAVDASGAPLPDDTVLLGSLQVER